MKKTILLALAAVLMLCGLSISVCADEAVWVPENGGMVIPIEPTEPEEDHYVVIDPDVPTKDENQYVVIDPIIPEKPGWVVIYTKPEVPGDADGDGLVTNWDRQLFARYFAGWKGINIDPKLADVNGNGKIDREDSMLVARYMEDWTDVEKYFKEGSKGWTVTGHTIDEYGGSLDKVQIEIISTEPYDHTVAMIDSTSSPYFSFELPKGSYHIVITKDGYNPYAEEFILEKQLDLGNIILEIPKEIPPTLRIDGIMVTSENADDVLGDGTVKYDFRSSTLTLINAEIEGASPIYSSYSKLNIYIPENTTSQITCSEILEKAICSEGSLRIYGNGTLIADGSATFCGFASNIGCAIYAENSITINEGLSITLGGLADRGIHSENGYISVSDINIKIGGYHPRTDLMLSTGVGEGDIYISSSTIKNHYFNLYSRIADSKGNIYIQDSVINGYCEADDSTNMISGGKIYIEGEDTKINIEVYKGNISTEYFLITAKEGVIVTDGLQIFVVGRNAGGETYYNNNKNVYSIRCVDGTYPIELLIE